MGTNLIKQGENVKGSVAQLAECSQSKREALGSSPGLATIFFLPCEQEHCNKFKACLLLGDHDLFIKFIVLQGNSELEDGFFLQICIDV